MQIRLVPKAQTCFRIGGTFATKRNEHVMEKNNREKCRLPMFRKAKSSNRQYFSRAEKSVLDIGKDV